MTPVQACMITYPPQVQLRLQQIMDLIEQVALSHPNIGPLDTTLKWGQIALRPSRPRTGTTIRLDWEPDPEPHCLFFVHCQTDLIMRYESMFGDLFAYEGARAICIDDRDPLPYEALAECITLALTYHL